MAFGTIKGENPFREKLFKALVITKEDDDFIVNVTSKKRHRKEIRRQARRGEDEEKTETSYQTKKLNELLDIIKHEVNKEDFTMKKIKKGE